MKRSMRIERVKRSLRRWFWDEKKLRLTNPNLGNIQLVSVCDNQGKELYQQPVFVEQRAEIDVIVNPEKQIAFVEICRPVVVPPNNYIDDWPRWKPSERNPSAMIPHPVDLGAGVTQLELPGGYTNDRLREGEEEIGCMIQFVSSLESLCPSTAFFATSLLLHVGKALPIPSGLSALPEEGIKKVVWLYPEEARGIKTLDSITLAALWRFRLWALNQEDEFWKTIGERM